MAECYGAHETLPGVATWTAPTAVTGARGADVQHFGKQDQYRRHDADGTIFTDAACNTGQQFPSVDALEEFRVAADTTARNMEGRR